MTLRCVVLVAKQPKFDAVVYKGICHITAKRFPYSVYFRAETQLIIILAVFYGSRDPNNLARPRLTDKYWLCEEPRGHF